MFEDEPVQKKSQIPRIALAVVLGLLIIAILLAFYVKMLPPQENTPQANGVNNIASSPTPSTTDSLGGQIYEKAQNPLDGKLETQTPVANPINDAYKNPFE